MVEIVSEEVWNERESSETKVLRTEFERCRVVVVEITTAGFTGTIDFQGKLHELSAYSNIPYIRQDQTSFQSPSVSQITLSLNTGVYRYAILGFWRRLQIVMTHSAGSITCGVAGSSGAAEFPITFAQISELSDSLGAVLDDVAIISFGLHSRTRTYPQNVSNTITLAGGGTANVFGSWTEAIPIDTVDFEYEMTGMGIEAANAATTYFIQVGYSIVDGTSPTTAQILGERRVVLSSPIVKAQELIDFHCLHCPANAKLWCRIKTAAGGSDELEVSVVVHRHKSVSEHVDHLTTWPWST